MECEELTGAQKFFALVYHYMQKRRQAEAIIHEIRAITATAGEDNVNIEELNKRKEKVIMEAIAIERLIVQRIKDADESFTRMNKDKFWLQYSPL